MDCSVRDRVQLSAQASPAEKTAVTMRQQHAGAGKTALDVNSSMSCSEVKPSVQRKVSTALQAPAIQFVKTV